MTETSTASRVLKQAAAWFVGVVVLPLVPILCLVVVKHASLSSAIHQGELFGLGVAVAGASLAIELILDPGGALLSGYRLGLLLILIGNVMFFAGEAAVAHGMVATSLDSSDRHASMALFAASVVFGLVSVIRQALADG